MVAVGAAGSVNESVSVLNQHAACGSRKTRLTTLSEPIADKWPDAQSALRRTAQGQPRTS
jgi:hypothetical protein